MSVSIIDNGGAASNACVRIAREGPEAVGRARFSCSSVQTEGLVYVSNSIVRPVADFSDTKVWAEIASAAGNVFAVPFPVKWIGCTEQADICSYVDGNL